MEVPRSSTPSRLTAVASRRTSLFTLGGTLAGVVLHAPTIEARKNNKKNEAKKKCKKQVAGCREQLRAFCEGNAACEAEILSCCAPLADCQAGDTVECAYAYLEQ